MQINCFYPGYLLKVIIESVITRMIVCYIIPTDIENNITKNEPLLLNLTNPFSNEIRADLILNIGSPLRFTLFDILERRIPDRS